MHTKISGSRAMRTLRGCYLTNPVIDTIKAQREATGQDLRTAIASLVRMVRYHRRSVCLGCLAEGHFHKLNTVCLRCGH